MAFATNLTATKSAAVGADVTFAIVAKDGVPPYTYVWSYKAAAGSYVVIDSAINPTAATASLVNSAVTTASSGTYKCEVTDNAGTKITSVECVLTVA